MKGLQGERLRQAFKYLDDNQDGFIRPDQFKRIILVSTLSINFLSVGMNGISRNWLAINYLTQ